MLLDEVVRKAYSATHPAEDLPLDTPFEKVVKAWVEIPNPSEAVVGNFLQQQEPPTIAMTLDTHSHFLPSMGEQTVRAMEAALS